MKKLILLFTLIFFAVAVSHAQYRGKPKPRSEKNKAEKQKAEKSERSKTSDGNIADRIWYGLNIGNLSFTNYSYNIGLTPMAGFKLTPELSAGLMLKFDYYFYRRRPDPKFSTVDLGPTIFARYKIFDQFFLQAEFERAFFQRLETDVFDNPIIIQNKYQTETFEQSYMYIGAGYSSGDRFKFKLSLHYNVLDDYDSVRVPLDYRIGFTFDF
jgi:hypothetical protein